MKGEHFYVNDSFLKMTGYDKPEEIYDTTSFDLIPETEFDKIEKAIEVTKEKGEWKGESKAINRSGEEINIKFSTNLIKDDIGQPICMMASFEDITERKERKRD